MHTNITFQKGTGSSHAWTDPEEVLMQVTFYDLWLERRRDAKGKNRGLESLNHLLTSLLELTLELQSLVNAILVASGPISWWENEMLFFYWVGI